MNKLVKKYAFGFCVFAVAMGFAIAMAFGGDADAAEGPRVTVAPREIQAGDSFNVRARGFDGRARLTVFASNSGRRVRFGWAVTDSWGRVDARMRTVAGMLPGVFTITVCRKGNCSAQSASARIVIHG
jgi:hypothetical protein